MQVPGGVLNQGIAASLACQVPVSAAELSGNLLCPSTEDVAASGGYWVLCAGDEVHALEGSLVARECATLWSYTKRGRVGR